jgi:thioester reductase-like protein
MSYFVTGATGFIGRFLIGKLLARKGTIHVLVRKGSQKKLDELIEKMGWDGKRIVPVPGDLAKPNLGVSTAQAKALVGKVKHFFHLAAVYDLNADAPASRCEHRWHPQRGATGRSHQGRLLPPHQFHRRRRPVSGRVPRGHVRRGRRTWTHPYFRTKHESEGSCAECEAPPYRIYRPSIVLGHSKTGEIDKIDGPYYFFTLLKKLREGHAPWMPTVGIEGGRINIVPVDFVVDAMDHIAHKPGSTAGCFHLTDPEPRRIGEVLNLFARAGHAPQMTMRLDARMFAFVPDA